LEEKVMVWRVEQLKNTPRHYFAAYLTSNLEAAVGAVLFLVNGTYRPRFIQPRVLKHKYCTQTSIHKCTQTSMHTFARRPPDQGRAERVFGWFSPRGLVSGVDGDRRGASHQSTQVGSLEDPRVAALFKNKRRTMQRSNTTIGRRHTAGNTLFLNFLKVLPPLILSTRCFTFYCENISIFLATAT
jgi:hypothetical protein